VSESETIFGVTLPVSLWAAIITATVGGIVILVSQWIGRSNLRLQMERDDRKRLQDARLVAYEAFFEKADLWSSIMAPDERLPNTPRPPVKYEDIRRLINEMIAASAPARLVAPAETVQLMIGYLGCASHVVMLAASDPHSAQTQEARIQAEQAHGRLTDAARKDVGNSSGSIALMYQRVS